jgi:DNA-3-methyladenine glycosylase
VIKNHPKPVALRAQAQLGSDGQTAQDIGQSKRIGITRAADRLERFYVRGNAFVSGPRSLNA